MPTQSINSLRFHLVTCCLQSWACGNKAIGAEGPELRSDEVPPKWIIMKIAVAVSLDIGVGDVASKMSETLTHTIPLSISVQVAGSYTQHHRRKFIDGQTSHKESLGTSNLINLPQLSFHEHHEVLTQLFIPIRDHLSHHHQKSNFHSALQLGHCHSTRPLSAAVLPSESFAVERPRRSSPLHVLGWKMMGQMSPVPIQLIAFKPHEKKQSTRNS